MAIQIEQFALAWHPTNGCAYKIKLANGIWRPWTTVSTPDLSALASIFAEKPIYLHPNGYISTDAEPIGE